MIPSLLTAACVAAAPAELEHDLRWELPVSAALGAWWLVSEFAVKEQLAPEACRWCARNALDDAGRAIRAPLAEQRSAAITSDLLGLALTPAVVFASSGVLTYTGAGTLRDGLLDVFFVLEAMVTSQALNQAVKFAVGRERPLAAALPPSQKPLTAQPEDNNLSFFSGHTSFTFSLVAAAATVARLRGYERWWLPIAVGGPFAVTTAVLRMVADKHYLTDVLTGAVVGVLLGVGLPLLLHRPVKVGGVTAWLTPAGPGVALQARW